MAMLSPSKSLLRLSASLAGSLFSPRSKPSQDLSSSAQSCERPQGDESANEGHAIPVVEPVLALLILEDKKGNQKERFPIQRRLTTLGRSMDNDVRFLTSEVSRLHCSIEVDPESRESFLHVMGPNGARLNGTQVFPEPKGDGVYPLHTGDRIMLAKRTFRFELLNSPNFSSAHPNVAQTSSPTSTSAQIASTPATTRTRRVRMSLVNIAQIDTPAKPSQIRYEQASCSSYLSSPSKGANQTSRRLSGINSLLQLQGAGRPSGPRNSLSMGVSGSMHPCTPKAKGELRHLATPRTAPPKQVSFEPMSDAVGIPKSSMVSLSPIKRTRLQPPMPQMQEDAGEDEAHASPLLEPAQDLFGPLQRTGDEAMHVDKASSARSGTDEDDEDEDLILIEEVDEDHTPLLANHSNTKDEAQLEQGLVLEGSPQSNKKDRRSSNFLGTAGPLKDVNLSFYSEERRQADEGAEIPIPEEEMPDAEPFMDAAEKADEPQPSPHLVPLPRRPSRMSSPTKRRVSLRTQILLRESEQYSDRLFIPPPPKSASGGDWCMNKSSSMPAHLSELGSQESLPATEHQSSGRMSLPRDTPETPESVDEIQDQEDEDEVDRSLGLASDSEGETSPKKATPTMATDPNGLPPSLTACQVSRSGGRVSMFAGSLSYTEQRKPTLVRMHFGRSSDAAYCVSALTCLSPLKKGVAKRVIRVSDVGLPPTDVSMGYELEDEQDEVVLGKEDEEVLAVAVEGLFDAAGEEDTDDELADDERHDDDSVEEDKENLPPCGSTLSIPATPLRNESCNDATPPSATNDILKVPAMDALRHLLSTQGEGIDTPSCEPATAASVQAKTPVEYGTLRDKMRADPALAELISPQERSERKKLGKARTSPSKRGAAARIRSKLPPKTPEMRELKHMLSEANVLGETPDVRFLRHVFALPAVELDAEPHLEAVKSLFRSHERELTSNNILDNSDDDGRCLRELLATPAAQQCILHAAVKVSRLDVDREADALDGPASPSVRKGADLLPSSLNLEAGPIHSERNPPEEPVYADTDVTTNQSASHVEDPQSEAFICKPPLLAASPAQSHKGIDSFLTVTVLDEKSHDDHDRDLFDEVRRLSSSPSSLNAKGAHPQPISLQDQVQDAAQPKLTFEPPTSDAIAPAVKPDVAEPDAVVLALGADAPPETLSSAVKPLDEGASSITGSGAKPKVAQSTQAETPLRALSKRSKASRPAATVPQPDEAVVDRDEEKVASESASAKTATVKASGSTSARAALDLQGDSELSALSSDEGEPEDKARPATSPVKSAGARSRKATKPASSPARPRTTRTRRVAAADEPPPAPASDTRVTPAAQRRTRGARATSAPGNEPVAKSESEGEVEANALAAKTRSSRRTAASSPVKSTRTRSRGTRPAASEADLAPEVETTAKVKASKAKAKAEEKEEGDEEGPGEKEEEDRNPPSPSPKKKATRSTRSTAIPAPKRTTARGRKALEDKSNTIESKSPTVLVEVQTEKKSARATRATTPVAELKDGQEEENDQQEAPKTTRTRATRSAAAPVAAATKKATRSKTAAASAKTDEVKSKSKPTETAIPIRTTRSRAAKK